MEALKIKSAQSGLGDQNSNSAKTVHPLARALRFAKPMLLSASLLAFGMPAANALAGQNHHVQTASSVRNVSADHVQRSRLQTFESRVAASKRNWAQLRDIRTQNDAGYVAFSNTPVPEPEVTSITGTWRVPLLWQQCGWEDTDHPAKWSFGFSSQWIGIGDHFSADHTLIQIGTIANFYFGKNADFLFYEISRPQDRGEPMQAVFINSVEVHPLDVIHASIRLVDNIDNIWELDVQNLTTHQKARPIRIKYDSSRLSAEWMEERDVGNMFGLMLFGPLPGFSQVNFDDLSRTDSNYATIGAVSAGISGFRHQQLTLWELENNDPVHDKPHLSAYPSSLDRQGRGFEVYKLDCTDSN